MMRRKDRQQNEEFARKILTDAEYGVLSLVDEKGNPYAIPISFALCENIIYIHGATEGTKLRILEHHSKAVLTCVGETHVLAEQFSTEYKSVIAYGQASIVADNEEKRRALFLFSQKYSPDFNEQAKAYIDRALEKTAVIAISIESLTAKAKLPKYSPQ